MLGETDLGDVELDSSQGQRDEASGGIRSCQVISIQRNF